MHVAHGPIATRGVDTLMAVGHDGLGHDGLGQAEFPLGALIGLAGAALGAYHGYKRNQSVGWAIAWATVGGIAPIIAVPVAVAQGFGKRK